MGRSDTTAKSAVAKASVRVVKSGSSAANAMARRFAPRLAATNGKHIAVTTWCMQMSCQPQYVNVGRARVDAKRMAAPSYARAIASGHLVHSTAPNASAAS